MSLDGGVPRRLLERESVRGETHLPQRCRGLTIGLMSARDERLAGNEALFREVNERVAEVATQFMGGPAPAEKVDFTCECGRADCSEPITMTVLEYEAIRAEPTHFGVAPEHEQPEIENVIRRFPSYFVVEKRDDDAQEVARDTDPRR
jgi:hypothetical protein